MVQLKIKLSFYFAYLLFMNMLQDILSAVPPEVLPRKWGGTSRTSAGMASSAVGGLQGEMTGICMGGKVPLFYQSVSQLKDIPGQNQHFNT